MMRRQKKWEELTDIQKVSVVILGVIQFTLLAIALWDIRQRSEDEINGSKKLWTLISFVNFIGPIAYFLFGRKRP